MKMKKLLSLLLALATAAGVFFQCPAPASAANETVKKATVLILDDSASMTGDALDALIRAADRFCEIALSDPEESRIAIVKFGVTSDDGLTVKATCDFTNDPAILKEAVRYTDTEWSTNIWRALDLADDLLKEITADEKNIVLLSDGLPNNGEIERNGRYEEDEYDYKDYPEDRIYANRAYIKAESYKERYFIYTVGFFHSLSEGDETAFASRFTNDLQNAGYYEARNGDELETEIEKVARTIAGESASEGNTPEENTPEENTPEENAAGTFRFANGSAEYASTYFYADEYFNGSSAEYKQKLATMSLCLALSALGSEAASSDTDQNSYVKELLSELKFTDISSTDIGAEKPSADIAVIAGQKKITDPDGSAYTLIAAAVRGNPDREWECCLTAGDSGDHEDFRDAANTILAFLAEYAAEKGIEGDIKLWLTGYGRAAAAVNLAAGYLDADCQDADNLDADYLGMIASRGAAVTLEKKDIYAYCFEAPAGTTEREAKDSAKYGNIFNIIDPNDPVTKLAPAALGFRRYGVDLILPTAENRYHSYSQAVEAMKLQYQQIEGAGEYKADSFVFKRIDPIQTVSGGKTAVCISEEQIPMSAFLDDLSAKLVQGYLGRASDLAEVEDGVKELCAVLSVDSAKAKKVLSETFGKIGGNLGALLRDHAADEDGTCEKVAGYFTASLKENGIGQFDETAVREAAKPLLKYVLACLSDHCDYFVTVVDNKSLFLPAHAPELCLAWMRSMDENYTDDAVEAFSKGAYRVIRVNGPVNVSVYDSWGSTVASFVDDEAQPTADGGVPAAINSDGEKLLYLPGDGDFTIELVGTVSGKASLSIHEFSYETGLVDRIVNYYDVPVKAGKAVQADVPATYDRLFENDRVAEYALTGVNGDAIAPDLNISGQAAASACFTVSAAAEDDVQGSVTGAGVRQPGDYAQVTAIPKEGFAFEGWYVDGENVSADSAYRFCVHADVALTARFTDAPPTPPTPPTPAEPEEPAGSNRTIITILIAAIGLVVLLMIVLILVSVKRKPSKAVEEIPVVRKQPADRKESEPDEISEERITEDRITDDKGKQCGLIQITNGSMNGFMVPIKNKETLFLGKDPKFAQIVFSSDYKNVSRLHCTVMYDAKTNRYFVTDTSTNGTFLMGKQRLEKGKRTPVSANTMLILANESCTVLLG